MSAIMPHRLVVFGGMGPGGTYRFADGSAVAPSIAFASDPDTGFYRTVADRINFAADGAFSLQFGTHGRIWGVEGNNRLELRLTGEVNLIAGGTSQNITLTPSGTGYLVASNGRIQAPGGVTIDFFPQGATSVNWRLNTNSFLCGTATDSSNGRLQLATHTTAAGGIGFGTDVSVYRPQAGWVAVDHLEGSNPNIILRQSGSTFGQVGTSGVTAFFGSVGSGTTTIIQSGNGVTALTLDASQNATFAGYVSIPNAQDFRWAGRCVITSPSDGVIRLTNTAQADFGRLQFGGTTASFPSIKRNGTALDFRLADDSNFCAINVSSVVFSSFGNITFPADGIALIRNNAGTDFGRLQLGGTSASFPALKRTSTTIEARLADDSSWANLKAGNVVTAAAATTAPAGQIHFGSTTATTVGAAGGASALPATPLGYVIINVAGTTAKLPYYNN